MKVRARAARPVALPLLFAVARVQVRMISAAPTLLLALTIGALTPGHVHSAPGRIGVDVDAAAPILEAPLPDPGLASGANTIADVAAATLPGSDGIWSVPFVHPASRQLHCAVYDPVRKREIVFGGPNHPLDLIWTLSLDDRVDWSFFRIAGLVPIPRYGATAIYDPVRDRVIMFGGYLPPYPNGVTTNEVWSLSLSGTPAWTRLEIGGPAPSARFLHTAIYDSANDRMIVYAGGSWSSRLGDVWSLDLSGDPGWTEIVAQTPVPPARREHAATYDPARNRMIVFGGSGPTGYLNDTWELSLSGTPAWRSIAEPGPGYCAGHSLIYDPIGDRVVLLGGNAPGSRFLPFSSGIWFLPAGGTGWTNIRYHRYFEVDRAPAVYDAGHHRIVAWGGGDPMNIPVISLTDPITYYEYLLPKPVVRTGQSAMYDPARGQMLLYGGRSPDSPMPDTWALSLAAPVAWSMLSMDGPDLEGHSTIYDPLRDRLIVFGGWGASNDVWQQRLAGGPVWTTLATAGERPEATVYHSAIYDPRRDRMIVFGGRPNLGKTWSLSLDGVPTWTALPPGPALAGHIAMYEPVGDRMLVLAGTQLWSLSLAEPMAWSQLAIEGPGPPPLWDPSATYDPIRHRVVLVGGCCFEDENGNAQAFADAWELSLDGPPKWRLLEVPRGPAGRNGASLVYDPLHDRAILWGGVAPDKVWFDDTWALTWGQPAKPAASCAGGITPESPLRLSYAVSNPLPAPRSVEWTLASERAWPGLPLRGFLLLGGGAVDTVHIELPLPDEALEEPNTLTFASWFMGADGYADSCRSLVPERPKAIALDLTPNTLGPGSHGRWVTGFLEPDPPPAAGDIDVSSIRLNQTVPVDPAAPAAIGDHDEDGIPDLMVKFDREQVVATLAPGEHVPVTVTGTVNGHPFSGTDHVTVQATKAAPVPSPVEAPRSELAIRGTRPAAGGRIRVELTLRDESPARLELLDVAGRALVTRQVGAMGPGDRSIDLAGRSMPPGIYFIRLTQAGTQVRARIAVLR